LARFGSLSSEIFSVFNFDLPSHMNAVFCAILLTIQHHTSLQDFSSVLIILICWALWAPLTWLVICSFSFVLFYRQEIYLIHKSVSCNSCRTVSRLDFVRSNILRSFMGPAASPYKAIALPAPTSGRQDSISVLPCDARLGDAEQAISVLASFQSL
jgi:hypothetical protein